MDLEFQNPEYARLEMDSTYMAGLSASVVAKYRQRLQVLRAAPSEQALRALKCLRLKALQGDRASQCALHLNDECRLILEIKAKGVVNTAVIVEIDIGR